MTQKRLFGISGAIATAALIGGLLAGCMEKDLYDPNYGKEPLPDPSEYFGFETRGDVKLSVNYDVPGLVALLEVYDEDPMEVVDNVPVYSDFRRDCLLVYIKLGSAPMRKTRYQRWGG